MTAPADPADAARWSAVEEATELLLEGSRDEALRLLQAELDRDPRNPYAWYYVGVAEADLHHDEPARAAYAEALRLSPAYLGAAVGVAQMLARLDRTAEAVRAGEHCLSLRPDDPDALFLLGMVHARREERAAAIRYLERFLTTRPEVEARQEAEALLTSLKGKARHLEPVS